MIAIALVFVFVLKYFWSNRRFFYLLHKIPWCNNKFALRDFFDLYHGDGKYFYQFEQKFLTKSENIAKIFAVDCWTVIVQKVEDVKIILNSKQCLDKASFVKVMDIDEGSLAGSLEAWQRHHKIFEPFFNSTSVRKLAPTFEEKSLSLVEILRKKVGESSFDIFDDLAILTLEMILHTMELKVDLQNCERSEKETLIDTLKVGLNLMASRSFKFWLHFDFILKRSNNFTTYHRNYSSSCYKFAPIIMQNVRQDQDEQSKSFIAALMDPKNNFSDKEIDDEIRTMIMAAQSTTALAISSTLLLLAMHKNIQDKLFEEICEIFPSKDSKIDFDLLCKLSYLDQVINESLRLFPVFSSIPRHADAEIQLSDCKIPKGIEILIPILKIHKNPSLWGDDAHLFKPERFERENFKKIHSYAFLPFAKGPRMCIGWKYAMTLMKINLAHLLMNFEFDTDLKFDELEFEICITLNVCGGYQVTIKERKF